MKIALWITASLILAFVAWSLYESAHRAKAKKLLPHILGKDWIEGKELRMLLRKYGARLSGPAFYQMMAGEDRAIESRQVQNKVEGHTIKKMQYRRRFGAAATASRSIIATKG